ncbi:hypothetical protein [Marimonas lutisalis]|uniref:hypothetical protein n=1 Tax=Marimonas lutisalis TaxID=2545756 RepID=UPI001F3B40D1|nr:hypothetical protein [Marimonas lutisalis]
MLPVSVEAQEPLSAIDWLSNPVPLTTRIVPRAAPLAGEEPPVTESAVTPQVTVQTLGELSADAVGLLPANVTGLPSSLWFASETEDLVRAIHAQDTLGLPAMQSLLYTLLLAEAEPPVDAGTDHSLLEARIEKLLQLGAVEPAHALLQRAGPETPELFSIWFDVSLLLGVEDEACAALNRKPFVSKDPAARIYCTARGGDWNAAALTLESAMALDLLEPLEASLLAQFLDPELVETSPELPPPASTSPLVFRLFEAAGRRLPTGSLPRAYAMADLNDTAGWKAELEAAERLTRTGALSENRLVDFYTARHPAASGGIWDRVEAIQRFDTAIRSGDPGAVASSLPRAWKAMQSVHLEVPFARFYAVSLIRLPITGEAGNIAKAIGLLSSEYEEQAARLDLSVPDDAFLAALASGQPPESIPDDPLARTIGAAFTQNTMPDTLVPLLEQDKLGEAILRAMALVTSGASGNFSDIEDGLRGLRALGLEDTARRASLQLMLLNQGG